MRSSLEKRSHSVELQKHSGCSVGLQGGASSLAQDLWWVQTQPDNRPVYFCSVVIMINMSAASHTFLISICALLSSVRLGCWTNRPSVKGHIGPAVTVCESLLCFAVFELLNPIRQHVNSPKAGARRTRFIERFSASSASSQCGRFCCLVGFTKQTAVSDNITSHQFVQRDSH